MIIWESSGSQLGAIWESSGRQLGIIWEPFGRHMGGWMLKMHLGARSHIMCLTLNRMQIFYLILNFMGWC